MIIHQTAAARVIPCFLIPVLLALFVYCQGCAGRLSEAQARGAHDVLNTVTDVSDPLYEGVVVACDAAEGAVLARPDTSFDDDRAAIARVRTVCDPIFNAFESLRVAQVAARQTIDAWAEGRSTREAALATVLAVQEAATEAARIWREKRPVLEALLRTFQPPAPGPGPGKLVLLPWGSA